MEFLHKLPRRVFEHIAGYRSMNSDEWWPVLGFETEAAPSLKDGWTVEDALRIIGLCAMLNSLNERDRGVVLDAVALANPRYYSVLSSEYGEV